MFESAGSRPLLRCLTPLAASQAPPARPAWTVDIMGGLCDPGGPGGRRVCATAWMREWGDSGVRGSYQRLAVGGGREPLPSRSASERHQLSSSW